MLALLEDLWCVIKHRGHDWSDWRVWQFTAMPEYEWRGCANCGRVERRLRDG